MKTILVPTDFSNNAESALFYAINLANKIQAKIILLHSFHVENNSAALPFNMVEKQLKAAKQQSDQQLKTLYTTFLTSAKHPIEFVSINNLAVDAILTIAEDRHVDLIIMGTQGVNGKLSNQLFGTNTSKVIEQAKCPVMAIPEERVHNNIKKMVYASEFLESDILCLQSLTDTAKAFEADIEVVHVSLQEKESDEEKQLLENFKQKVIKHNPYHKLSFKLVEGRAVDQKLEAYLEESDADMLVMSAHQRNLKDKLFGKSNTKLMSFYIKIPLLVFHHKRNKSDNAADHIIDKLIF